jgi:hypothetical protein
VSKTLILLLALLVMAGLAAAKQEPEIRRYLKMRSM